MDYLLLSSILTIGAFIVIYWLHSQAQMDIPTPPVAAPSSGERVSVIVPARNEEKNIGRCVQALLAQDYPNFEIIVLDDRSTDQTRTILEGLAGGQGRITIVSGQELPAGWAGKPHALHQASQAASGEWFLFIDADTFLEPNALSAALASAIRHNADLYTVMTEQILGSFWEKTVMPLIMTALSVGFSPNKVNDPTTKDAIANGQFILIRESVYRAVGGHAKIFNQIVEDKAISELVKWNGYRLLVADGTGIARTRMYTSLPEMWEGWTKNIYLGLSDRPGLLLLGVFGAILALLAALVLPVWPLLGFWWLFNGGGLFAAIITIQALCVWAYIILARASVAHRMSISRWYAVTTPLGAGVFAGMMATSAWKILSGKGVTWKGRIYDPKLIR